MVDNDESPSSPMAVAMAWVSRITTIALEMVLPGVAGVWVDGWLGTKVLFTVLGFALGLTVAIVHLLRFGPGKSPERRDP